MATTRQKIVYGKLVENGRNGQTLTLGAIMLEAGYSKAIATVPAKVIKSKGFQELLDEAMPDDDLLKAHTSLLKSTKIEHMVFPLGPKGDDDPNLSGAKPDENAIEKAGIKVERTTLSDQEIKDMLAEVNCKVKRIVHGETARHVYYWTPNTKAQQDALKLAYDIKGKLTSKEPPGDSYNVFLQQNNLNPNAPASKPLVDATLATLMDQTKRKVLDVKPDGTPQ